MWVKIWKELNYLANAAMAAAVNIEKAAEYKLNLDLTHIKRTSSRTHGKIIIYFIPRIKHTHSSILLHMLIRDHIICIYKSVILCFIELLPDEWWEALSNYVHVKYSLWRMVTRWVGGEGTPLWGVKEGDLGKFDAKTC